MKTLMLLLSFVSLIGVTAGCAATEKNQMIRFYKLNKKEQQNRVLMNNKTAKLTGCHNFLTKARVYRITQIGFEYCSLYQKKNCADDSIVNGLWKEKDSASKLTQGGQWLFHQEHPRGIKIKSWKCQ